MESQHSFCAKCGNLLTEEQRFCANCGTERMGTMTSSNMGTGVSTGGVARKSRKKLWVVLGSAALVLTLILAVIAVLAGFGNKDRTIMVYMIGSDLESEAAAASLDINEMKGASFDPEHTKVILYTGGTKRWALDEISADENAIYELANGKISKVQTYEKSAMTNPEPLVTFVNYAYHNYPAGSYDLILWDHGGGPIVGYGHDENYTFSDPMKVPELAEALAGTDLVKSGGRFDMIGFDACLMGSMEVAKAFSGFSDYLVASEEVEPGRGWDYNFLSDLGNGRVNNTEELGRSIIDHYVDFYVNNDYDVDLTLSLVDLRRVNRVIDAVDGLFAVVKETVTSTAALEWLVTFTEPSASAQEADAPGASYS